MRLVVIPVLLAALFATGSAFATPAAQLAPDSAATSSPAITSTAGPAPKVSPADQKRIDAIQQYQHDLVNVVALRAEPDYLLGAAILAKPFTDQTPGLDFDALSQRAAAATGAGPAAEWTRLGVCKDKSDCPNAKADAYLKKHAAGNAAIWLVDLDLAAANKDAAAERKALARAASAQTYDDYYGKVLAGVGKAVAVLPPLADTTQGAHDGQPDNGEGVRLFVAINATQSHLRPDLGPLVELCGAPWTSPETISRAREIYRAIGQVPVTVNKEINGFVLNRLQGALLAEAFRLVGEGYISAEDLDHTVKDGLGLRWSFLGPFETIELNAPGGIPDYCARYTGFYKELAAASAGPEVYQSPNVDRVIAAWPHQPTPDRIAKLTTRRNERLAALVAHKGKQAD